MTFNKTYGLRETDKRLDRLLRKNARGKLHQVNNGGRSDIPGFLARIARKHCDVSFPAFRAIVIVWDWTGGTASPRRRRASSRRRQKKAPSTSPVRATPEAAGTRTRRTGRPSAATRKRPSKPEPNEPRRTVALRSRRNAARSSTYRPARNWNWTTAATGICSSRTLTARWRRRHSNPLRDAYGRSSTEERKRRRWSCRAAKTAPILTLFCRKVSISTTYQRP